MTRKSFILVALVATSLCAGSVLAQTPATAAREMIVPAENITLLWHVPPTVAAPQAKGLLKVAKVPGPLADPLAIYSNVDNATGSAFSNFTPIAADGSFTAIRIDDTTFTTAASVGTITSVVLAVYNASAATINAIVRWRAWLDNGGTPGTYWGGFSSAAIDFAPGGSAYNFNVSGFGWTPPSPGSTVTFWQGMQFSASFDTDAAELGMYLYDPPVVGSSTDVMFAGDTAATMHLVNNPTGSTFNFGGAPVASAYFEIRVSALPVELQSFSAE